ncbi:MAG TPA: undecaprenyl-diphosphate phosphatase [Bacteroidota bacterium]|nr:undecaprenyl-diphosphate phosphatase [Bacteroidota bacterium]
MNILDGLILGIIQGITEFLPISSTAHLTIAGKLMGLVDPGSSAEWTATIAIMQLGTAVSVLVFFRAEVRSMAAALLYDLSHPTRARREGFRPDSRLAFLIAAGTLPIVVLGFLLKNIIEGDLTKDTTVIAWSLIILAVILLVAELTGRGKRGLPEKTPTDAILIGFAQALALIPGASRSGTTITAGLFLGFTREAAARFSFLLSIPAVIAGGLYEMFSVRHLLDTVPILPLAISVAVSGITGYLAIAFLLHFLKKRSTAVFIVYRVLLGVALLVWF